MPRFHPLSLCQLDVVKCHFNFSKASKTMHNSVSRQDNNDARNGSVRVFINIRNAVVVTTTAAASTQQQPKALGPRILVTWS